MNDNGSVKQQINQLTIIYIAMILGQIFFLVIIFFIFKQNGTGFDIPEAKYVFTYLAPLLTIGAIPAGYFLYSRQCKNGANLESIEQKFNTFRTASIIKYALFEFAGMINLLAYMFTYSQQFIFLFLIVIVIFLINKPSESRFNSDLNNETESF